MNSRYHNRKQNHPFRAIFIVLLIISVPAGLYAVAPADSSHTEILANQWYVLMLQDQRAGYAHEMVKSRAGNIITDTELNLSVRRGPTEMKISQKSRFVETEAGEPVEAINLMDMGSVAIRQRYRFLEDGIEQTITQPGSERTNRLPAIEEDWLPPAAAARFIRRRIVSGDEKIKLATLDVGMGPSLLKMEIDVLGEENIDIFGRTVPATLLKTRITNLSGMTMLQYVDEEARPLKANINMMAGMSLTMIAADKSLATAELDPPEMMVKLFIRPGKPIPTPRGLKRAVYRLDLKRTDLWHTVTLPRTGCQRVVWSDEKTAAVVIDLTSPVSPTGDLPGPQHTESSMMINYQHDDVLRLLKSARLPARKTGSHSPTEIERAELLRRFVAGYITAKDLSVGLATAGEVARTAQGDCTEHAVLLAALLRADGIPSRTVSGLIYTRDEFLGHNDVFAYHMWTQAWLDTTSGHHWVDLDPTIEPSFDAAHIALSVSAMADKTITNDLVNLLPIVGNLHIDVVTIGSEQ